MFVIVLSVSLKFLEETGHRGEEVASIFLNPDFDSLKIPFFLRSDNQYIVKSADFSG